MKTICKTAIKPADEASLSFRVVMRLDSTNTITPYVVHYETDPETAESAYCLGDYCENMLEAFRAYVAKCQRNGIIPLDAIGTPVKGIAEALN